ncbi:hypothetical protein DBV33_04380 [Pseudomonas fluorescens]|nr:hypothetical protein DBV33_04380 [Pseudomonas fluorescens]POA39092.1 hypothetical protein C1891_06570 [Pseudomonas sp. GW456-12-1-14-TSB6]
MIVPTLRRGNAPRDALRHTAMDAERPRRHSHAERGNDPQARGHRQPSSLLFSSSFTCCGLALPLEAFMA